MAVMITNENVEQEVNQSELPVLLDVYATWCGPCQQMAPIFDELEKDRAYYAKLTEEELVSSYAISDEVLSAYKSYVKIRTRNQLIIDFDTHDSEIRHYLKAAIASQLFNDNLAYQIKDSDDKMVNKVIELLKR